MRGLSPLPLWLLGALVLVAPAQEEIERSIIRQLWSDGAAAYQRGRPLAAIRVWQEAVRLDPGNEPIKQKIELVRGELTAYPVAEVLDGETLAVTDGARSRRVKLVGVDSARRWPRPINAQEAATAAAGVLRELVGGQSVYLSAREPGVVFTAPELVCVNEALLRRGVARATGELPGTRLKKLKGAERAAQAEQAGFWRGFRPIDPYGVLPSARRVEGRLLVPMRPLVVWLGGKFTTYDNGEIVAACRDFAIQTTVKELDAMINGRNRSLDRPPVKTAGYVWAPVHMICAPARAECWSVPVTGEVYVAYKGEWTLLP